MRRILGEQWSSARTSLLLPLLAAAACSNEQPAVFVDAGTPETGPSVIRVFAASTASVGQCVPVILALEGPTGKSTVPAADLSIQVGGVQASEIFSDSGCGNAQALPVGWAAGAASKVVYLKPSLTQHYSVQFAEATSQVVGAVLELNVMSSDPDAAGLKLALAGPAAIKTGQCAPYAVSLQNTAGVLRTRTAATSVTLTGSGSGAFYAGANCAGEPVGSVLLPAGASTTAFSLRDGAAENLLLQADAGVAGIAGTVLPVQVEATIRTKPAQLAMSGPALVASRSCSPPVQVRLLDNLGNMTLATSKVSFTLNGNLGFGAYADSNCTTALASPAIEVDASSMSFYFTVQAGGTLTITADDGGPLTDASISLQATSSATGTAFKIAVTGPTTVTAGSCSSAFLVRTQDGAGVDFPVSAGTRINLTGKGAGDFYSDGTCGTAISYLDFSAGDSSKAFYYRTGSVGALVFNADDAGPLLPGTASVTAMAGPATKLALAGPTPINLGDCRAYVATSQDANGLASPVLAATVVNLTRTGSGTFYSESSCGSVTTAATINPGQTNAIFFYRSMSAGTTTLQADAGNVLAGATLPVTVTALPAVKVVLTRPLLRAGACQQVKATLKDALDGAVLAGSAVAVGLAGTGSGSFHAASDCGAGSAATGATVAAEQSSATFYYKNNKAEAVTITASATGLAPDAWEATVAPGAPARLALTGPATVNAGACVPYTVQVQDVQGNLSPPGESALVTMTGGGRGRFSNAGDCTTANPTLSLAPGATQGVVFFQDQTAEAVELTASAAGLASGSLPVTVATGRAIKLAWTVPAASGPAGACLAGSLQVRDALDNPVVQTTALAVTLGGLSSATAHATADCSGAAVTGVSIAAGQSGVGLSVRDAVAETLAATASASGLTVGNQALTFVAGPPTRLALSGPAAVLASDCTAYTLRLEDALGNAAGAGAAVTVNFSGLSNGRLYADAGCTAQVSSAAFAAGTSARTLYLADSVAETLSVTAAASGAGLTPATLNIAVGALPAVRLALGGAGTAQAGACTPLSVRVEDVLGNGVPQGADRSVSLGGNGSGAFHGNETCTAPVEGLTIAAGTTWQELWFRSTVPESLTLTARSAGLADAAKGLVVTPQPPTKIVWSGVTSIAAGSCTGYTLTLQDAVDNLSPVAAGKTVVLSGAGTGGAFYSDSACAAPITSVVFGGTQASAAVYYKSSAGQLATLTADDLGQPDLTAGTLQVTVTASGGPTTGASKLYIAGTSTVVLSTCAAFAVIAHDAAGVPADVDADAVVSLTGNGAGVFFSDAACASSTTSVTIEEGTSNAFFYFRTARAGSYLFMATASGLSLDSHAVDVPPASGGGGGGGTYVPIKLLVTGPSEVLSSSCGGQFTVSSVDALNQLTPVQAQEVITLTNGAGNGIFYSDAACTTIITGMTFPAGASQGTFYFKDAQAESVSLQAYSANLVYGSLSVQVRPSGRLNLSMVSSGTSVWQNFIYRSRGTLSDRVVVLQNVGLTQANNVTLHVPSISAPFSFRGGAFPGLGGTCANNAVLLPNQQCTMIVRFQPTSVATFTDNLKVTYSVGSANLEVNLPLSGTANNNLNPMAVVAGANHTCVSLTDMSTKCFGLGGKGQLGVGSEASYGVANQDIESLSWTPYGHFATQIAAGAEHTCALMPDGGVVCWGDNTYGQLGTGGTANVGAQPGDLAAQSYAFVQLGTGKSATKIAAGAYHTCALLQDGAVKCWGANSYGQLGQGDNVNRGRAAAEMGDALRALDFGVGQVVVDLAAGANHSCVVLRGGQLKCWGRNIFGQLGIGSTADMGDNAGEMGVGLSPVSLGSGATVLSVGAGTDHTCAILTVPSQGDPIVKCWGRNDYGQLGIGDALQRGTSPSQMGDALPIVDLGLSGVPRKMALGRVHSCVLLATGSVKCWGSNQYGQTGLSEATSTHRGDGSNEMGNFLPTVTLGNSVLATDLTAGSDHNCALIDTNRLRCWGRNDYGQLGHDHAGANVPSWGHSTKTMANLPDSWVNSYSYYEDIATDSKYTCALSRSQREVVCWGNATQSGVSYPTRYHDFGGANGVKQLEAGTNFMCALGNDSKLYCWGDNGWYTDNSAAATTSYAAPNPSQPLLSEVAQFAAGEGFVCALTTSNAIKCFGHNIASILGTTGPGAYVTAANAVTFTIPSASPPASIAAGASHACVVDGVGGLFCWGANDHGQLGDSTNTYRGSPVVVPVGGPVARVSLGRRHTCAALANGAVSCWGDNQYGQVGVGAGATSFKSPQPVALGGSGTAKGVGLGEDSSCAIMSDDKLRCWGRNGVGELAAGNTVNQHTPTAAVLGEDFRVYALDAPRRGRHRCAIGWEHARQVPFQLKCWGDNAAGQLGYRDTTNRGDAEQYTGRAILPLPQNTVTTQPAIASVPLAVRRPNSGYAPGGSTFAYTTPSSSAVTLYTAWGDNIPTSWVAPSLHVKMWGGGGGGGSGNRYYGSPGGHGGYVSFDVPAGQITDNLSIYVAGKGNHGGTYSCYTGGSGGGSSALVVGSVVLGVAGGGGGGGGGGQHSNNYCGTPGGGGGATGANGSNTNGYYATGGTTTSAGGGGTPYPGYSHLAGAGGSGPGAGSGGNANSYNMSSVISGGVGYGRGGNGTYDGWYNYGGGAGGGAGYYGGGGGAFYDPVGWYGCGPSGAGGSNYIAAIATVVANNSASNSTTAPGTADPDYGGGVAVGGGAAQCGTGSDAGNGRVVIKPY